MRIVIAMRYAVSATLYVACSAGITAGKNDRNANHAMGNTVGAPQGANRNVAEASRTLVDRDLERIRTATAAFKSLDAAVAAGYQRNVPQCIAHPTLGGMGYHHTNDALRDDKLDLDHPEILVYGKTSTGEYRLNGVEFYVPFSAHPRTSAPPEIMGHQLTPFDPGKFWYLHVWVWTDNPSGMFADWDPDVKC
jgi:hypothetical protein